MTEKFKDFMYGVLTLAFIGGVFDAAYFGMFFWDGIARIITDVTIIGVAGLLASAIGWSFIKIGELVREYTEERGNG